MEETNKSMVDNSSTTRLVDLHGIKCGLYNDNGNGKKKYKIRSSMERKISDYVIYRESKGCMKEFSNKYISLGLNNTEHNLILYGIFMLYYYGGHGQVDTEVVDNILDQIIKLQDNPALPQELQLTFMNQMILQYMIDLLFGLHKINTFGRGLWSDSLANRVQKIKDYLMDLFVLEPHLLEILDEYIFYLNENKSSCYDYFMNANLYYHKKRVRQFYLEAFYGELEKLDIRELVALFGYICMDRKMK